MSTILSYRIIAKIKTSTFIAKNDCFTRKLVERNIVRYPRVSVSEWVGVEKIPSRIHHQPTIAEARIHVIALAKRQRSRIQVVCRLDGREGGRRVQSEIQMQYHAHIVWRRGRARAAAYRPQNNVLDAIVNAVNIGIFPRLVVVFEVQGYPAD